MAKTRSASGGDRAYTRLGASGTATVAPEASVNVAARAWPKAQQATANTRAGSSVERVRKRKRMTGLLLA